MILSLWDGLGITHNRRAMRLTGERLLDHWDGVNTNKGVKLALKLAGFSETSDIMWNLKAVRPENHPKKRIKEAVHLTFGILNTPFDKFLKKDSIVLWEQLCEYTEVKGSSRLKILFGTVYLPALYTVGMLFSHKELKEQVRTTWSDLQSPIPRSLLKKFKALHLDKDDYRSKLGSIHQLKSYCKPRKCSECFVLKNAIQS